MRQSNNSPGVPCYIVSVHTTPTEFWDKVCPLYCVCWLIYWICYGRHILCLNYWIISHILDTANSWILRCSLNTRNWIIHSSSGESVLCEHGLRRQIPHQRKYVREAAHLSSWHGIITWHQTDTLPITARHVPVPDGGHLLGADTSAINHVHMHTHTIATSYSFIQVIQNIMI
jgi:hypothetical protein